MKKWVGWILLAASLFVTYQGWRNSQPGADTHELSRRAACEGKDGCRVEGEQPQKLSTDFLARTYEWKTSTGPISVRCQRAYVFAGIWSCT